MGRLTFLAQCGRMTLTLSKRLTITLRILHASLQNSSDHLNLLQVARQIQQRIPQRYNRRTSNAMPLTPSLRHDFFRVSDRQDHVCGHVAFMDMADLTL